MSPVPGPTSRALWGVRGGMRKPSPACRVRVARPSMAISTVPVTMYPTSSPGWMCQPDSTPTGISVSTCTMSRPGIEDGLCWISVRLSLLASASRGGCGLAAGYVTKISLNQAAVLVAAQSPRTAVFRRESEAVPAGVQLDVDAVGIVEGHGRAVQRCFVEHPLRRVTRPGHLGDPPAGS